MTALHTVQNVTGPTVIVPVPPEFAGKDVEIKIRVVPKKDEQWGEGLKRCAGALADDPEWDAIMAEIYRERKKDSRKEAFE